MDKVNLSEKFNLFSEQWKPHLIATVDNYAVKVAKLQGEFVWHHHEEEDELFMVIKGQLTIKLRDGEIVLNEGEMVVIPKGIEHLPVANDEAHILLFERKGTLNTGNVQSELTREQIDEI
ncbi:MAG: cupin domain-containing protein [Chloroflexi bacterium]|nr:cupin domain-containing protein [Chloroflexota bacterium]